MAVGASPAHRRVLSLWEMSCVVVMDSCIDPSAAKELLVPLYNPRSQQRPPRLSTGPACVVPASPRERSCS